MSPDSEESSREIQEDHSCFLVRLFLKTFEHGLAKVKELIDGNMMPCCILSSVGEEKEEFIQVSVILRFRALVLLFLGKTEPVFFAKVPRVLRLLERSELIAIDEALRIIKTMTSPDEIWILCDSRSAIQHLSDWTNVGDKTSVSILKNLKELSQQHEIYFQWIPSHIGLFGNDTADLLAKEGVTENLMSRRTLTFSEIFSKTKSLIQELWKTPPTHPWYNRQAPGGALSIKADRVVQTTISRLASGHIRGLSFNLGH
ncbi:RNase H domain-containing protein [Trichonephila clavipes]|nr:RNase H domain-containing protein [Trichonephila clavipes]